MKAMKAIIDNAFTVPELISSYEKTGLLLNCDIAYAAEQTKTNKQKSINSSEKGMVKIFA